MPPDLPRLPVSAADSMLTSVIIFYLHSFIISKFIEPFTARKKGVQVPILLGENIKLRHASVCNCCKDVVTRQILVHVIAVCISATRLSPPFWEACVK